MCLLETKSLNKDYGNHKGIFDFSFKINEGDIVGLIGVNGAGKTTLLNTISGNILANSGEMFYEGNLMGLNSHFRKNFGVSVNPGFYDYQNTYNNLKSILFLNDIIDKDIVDRKIKEVLDIVGLKNVEHKKIKEFSFGMKQRLGFAQAILNTKTLMILDEPFVGLDINGRDMVKNYIKEIVKNKKIAVIFSDHNLDEVKSLCNRLIVIRDGKKVYDGNFDIESSLIIKVEDSSKINNDYAKEIDNNTICIEERNLNEKLNHISSVTKILKIEKIINPLEEMLKEGNDEKNNKI